MIEVFKLKHINNNLKHYFKNMNTDVYKFISIALFLIFIIFISVGIGITVDYERNNKELKNIIENKECYIYKLNQDVITYNIEVENYKDSIVSYNDSINSLINELDSINEELQINKIKIERIREYNRIAAQGNNIKFLRGWINRVIN